MLLSVVPGCEVEMFVEAGHAEQEPGADGTGVVAVIGSGFGGAVVTRRLAQANRALDQPLKIVLFERGRRYEPEDFPRLQLPERLTSDPALQSSKRLPEAARLAWTYDQGLWQIRDLGGLRVALAAGYGGGSLIYASVHLRPPNSVFENWPHGYCRAALDPYYTLVEAMLDARPAPQAWKKTERMTQVAHRLGRESWFFRPPIAVTFDESRTSPKGNPPTRDNGFGVQQSGCVGCGDCIIGCPHRAKNTLDRNYLAGIEDLGVRVRTMSEVVRVEPQSSADGTSRFCVRYLDHLKGAMECSLAAEYVFVCAGAIGSTELLHRSNDGPAESRNHTGLSHLGQRFFANGDAPGVVFGTKEPWRSSEGPTITTSLYHAEGKNWFLLQEGGIPPTLERGLGFLQSPLWFGRNAFGSALTRNGDTASPQTVDSLHELAETICHVPRVSKAFAAAARGQSNDQDLNLSLLLPKSLRDLLSSVDPPGTTLARHIRQIDHGVVDRVAKRYQAEHPIFGILIAWLIRRVGNGAAVTEATLEELVSRFSGVATVRDSSSAVVLALRSVLELILGPAPANTAILLAMGPDSEWTMDWNEHSHRLSAAGKMAANVALYGSQERLMRDVAESVAGELRTNPGWTLGRHPLTVHAQGGCSMSEGLEGVTEPDGLMVRGIDGLYVFDASVFPGSVGVNPSSTIAAVAERNIELFIRSVLGKRTPALREWTAAAEENKRFEGFEARMAQKARQWRDGAGKVIDDTERKPRPTNAGIVGLEWREVMEGFIGDLGSAAAPDQGVKTLQAARFRDLERAGQRGLQHVRATLTCILDDLEEALLNAKKSRFRVCGELQVSWSDTEGRRKRDSYRISKGKLEIDLAAADGIGSMKYDLEAAAGESVGDNLTLCGVKQLREDPGVDAWKDLTTLYTKATRARAAGNKTYAGILRVPLLDFVGTQLPSMDVIGDDISPARKTFLLQEFARNFFRGLERIYTIGEL